MSKEKLKDLTSKIGSGATPKGGENSYKDYGISLIRSQNVLDFSFNYNNLAKIDEQQAKLLNNVEVFENDILLNITGDSIARTCIVPHDVIPARVNQHVSIIRANNSIDNKYLFYYLQFLKKYLLTICRVGGTRNALTKEALENLKINVPKTNDYQYKLVKILYNIDSKIELNNKINAKLEAMAKTIYDYWFVQFDFPDENGKPYKSSGGKMIWKEELKREIPEGWEVSNIQNYCQIIDCLHSKKPDINYESEEFYLLQLENLIENGYIDVTNKYYITKEDYSVWTKKIEITENDFVFTNAGRTGAFGKIPKDVKCALGRNFTAIRPFNISPYYLRMFFNSIDMQKQILSNLDCGAFFQSFNVKSIKLINILLPEKNVLKQFIDLIIPIIENIEINNAENQKLAKLRDWLLPMLMNGQVTFKDVEKSIEDYAQIISDISAEKEVSV